MSPDRVTLIRSRLENSLQPESLEVVDESHLHAGHPGAATGMGHFRVHIVSPCFTGLNQIERHRLVYDALGSLMQTDIHALSVTAVTPDAFTKTTTG